MQDQPRAESSSIPPTPEQEIGESILDRIRASRHVLPLRRTRAWVFVPRNPHKTTEQELRRAYQQFKAAHKSANADLLIATRDVLFRALEDFLS